MEGEQTSGRRTQRGRRISSRGPSAINVDGCKRGLEQGVDSNTAWTYTKRGLERDVELNKARTT